MDAPARQATMLAVVVDTKDPRRLLIKEVVPPEPKAGEMLVKVHAISLNRGETRMALSQAADGWRPGWDAAGVVERAAADGSGPAGRITRCLHERLCRLGRVHRRPVACGRGHSRQRLV